MYKYSFIVFYIFFNHNCLVKPANNPISLVSVLFGGSYLMFCTISHFKKIITLILLETMMPVVNCEQLQGGMDSLFADLES